MDAKPLRSVAKFSTSLSFHFSPTSSLKSSHTNVLSCCPKFRLIYRSPCNCYAKDFRPLISRIATSSNTEKFNFTEKLRPCRGRRQRIIVKSYPRFNFGNGGGGNNDPRRVVFNVVMAGALTYLTVTGKIGWVFDAVVSLSLFAVIVPVVGAVAFLWFAGREMLQGTCPNCGKEFQIFEFALMDGPQLCPYCTQPFELEEFLTESPRFSSSKGFEGFKQTFDGFDSQTGKQDPSIMVVDVEAEVKDKD